jgi:hypothetical protein
MSYFLLFLALFLQLNASGYTDYHPQKDCAQKTLTAESSENNEHSFVLFRYQGQYEDSETGLDYNRFRYYSPEEGMYLNKVRVICSIQIVQKQLERKREIEK